MDMNLYVAELRLAGWREPAARRRLVPAARSARPRLRVMVGHALRRLGRQPLAGVTVPEGPSRTLGARKEPC
jgi:hypothetical protein